MSREDARDRILAINNRTVLLELPTGYGKSLMGMDWVLKYNPESILIVVPYVVHKRNWRDEFIKWGNESYLDKVTFSTYMGLDRIHGHYDCVILDEAHHVTERIIGLLRDNIDSGHTVMLSATVKKQARIGFGKAFPDFYCYRIGMKEAIEDEVLPDPRVYLVPLDLDNTRQDETIVKNPRGKVTMLCEYKDRWKFIRDKTKRIVIRCTQAQKSLNYDTEVTWWKNRYMCTNSAAVKNRWLHLAGERLKWLATVKTPMVRRIQNMFPSERMLTFCGSIEQTEALGKNCINSRNKKSDSILREFNEGGVSHITACNMINEGMNLANCRIGLYANLNSSEIIVKQRLGRILRHRSPVIIIPFFRNTREEELVRKMMSDYNPELVRTVESINDIQL